VSLPAGLKERLLRLARPAYVEKRRSVGHWEIDTVVGGGTKDCVTTLVERKTGYAFIGKLRDRSKFENSKRLKMLIRRAPDQFKTITADNGSEFHDYVSVEQASAVKVYFATPYHSWERGSNAKQLDGHMSYYQISLYAELGGGTLVERISAQEPTT